MGDVLVANFPCFIVSRKIFEMDWSCEEKMAMCYLSQFSGRSTWPAADVVAKCCSIEVEQATDIMSRVLYD